MTQKIVLTGAPGTGKTTIIQLLKQKQYHCLDECSRDVIKQYQQQGITNIFEKDPILFSQEILQQRILQYKSIQLLEQPTFIDRGIQDINAYLKQSTSQTLQLFEDASKEYLYDMIFIFPPWQDIYTKDEERMEDFENTQDIHNALLEEYRKSHKKIYEVPKDTPENRVEFILNKLNV